MEKKNYILVSAIITTHNRKKLLIDAIESVLSQTYKKIECIVVDDASEDGTEFYVQKYIAQHKIKYIYISPQDSKGGNYARNIGIKNAHGKYIAFLDDDDMWFDTKIEKQVQIMESDAKVGFVYCGSCIEKDFSANTRKLVPENADGYIEGYIAKEILIRILTTTTTTIMVKKEILEETGYFDEYLKFWQEYEWCIRVLQKTKCKAVKENLVLYRKINNDVHRLSNKIAGWEDAVKYIEHKHKELIDSLTEEENNQRKVYVYIDGLHRAIHAKSVKYGIKYILLSMKRKEIRKIFYKKIYNKYRKNRK